MLKGNYILPFLFYIKIYQTRKLRHKEIFFAKITFSTFSFVLLSTLFVELSGASDINPNSKYR